MIHIHGYTYTWIIYIYIYVIICIHMYIYILCHNSKSPNLSHHDPLNVYLGNHLEVGMRRRCSIQLGLSQCFQCVARWKCFYSPRSWRSDLVKISINSSVASVKSYPKIQENTCGYVSNCQNFIRSHKS